MLSAKKILPLILAALLASCSSKKSLPEGKRVSVIDTPVLSVQNFNKSGFNLSEPKTLTAWTQVASNAQHLNQNMKMASETQKRWTVDFGDGSSKRDLLLAAPVVQNGVIYTQDVKGTVRAFDLKSGDRIFKQKLVSLNKNDSDSGLNGAGLALGTKNLYALTGFGGVFALNALTGEILWRQDLNTPIRTAPTFSNGMLFVQTIDNRLLAFEASTGSEMWRYNISAEDTVYAGGASPVVDEGKQTIINAFSNGELQAFNTKIGYSIWSQNLINTQLAPTAIHALRASPVVENHIVYAASNNDQTIAADVETGEILWQTPVGGMSTPLVDKEAVFLVTNNHELLALSKENGRIFWQTPLLDDMSLKDRLSVYVFSPLLINGKLLVATSNGWLLKFNPKTGQFLSEDFAGEDLAVQPIVVDGHLILTSKSAKLIVFQ